MAKSGLLSPDEALSIILSSVRTLDTEKVELGAVFGRVLSEDVCAEEDLPPFANSAMDGYAVIAEDTLGAAKDSPKSLKVLAEEPAGTVISQPVVPGTAVRIMTGAPVPSGANAVVMVEDTESRNGDVCIYSEAASGDHIRPAGEDVMRGELILRRGTKIGPSGMGMLAAVGRAEVEVYRRPRVAVVTTGDEIVDVSETPGPGKIRDSNRYSILGQVLKAGGEVSVLERVTDERDELEQVLLSASESSDVVITSGGVSVGDYDFVKETLAKLGDIRFWKVAIKPGKPLAFGNILGKPLFGLPGNPVSSMVTFDLFVRPALLRMSGVEAVAYTVVSGTVTEDLKHKAGRREFVRATTRWKYGGYVATPTGAQGSGRLSSMLGANSYIMIPEGRGDIPAGDRVEVMLLELGAEESRNQGSKESGQIPLGLLP